MACLKHCYNRFVLHTYRPKAGVAAAFLCVPMDCFGCREMHKQSCTSACLWVLQVFVGCRPFVEKAINTLAEGLMDALQQVGWAMEASFGSMPKLRFKLRPH